MVDQTGLEPLCHLADSPAEMKTQLQALFREDFGAELIGQRKELLENGMFSNAHNIEKLVALIFG
jgi:hypothetical protein